MDRSLVVLLSSKQDWSDFLESVNVVPLQYGTSHYHCTCPLASKGVLQVEAMAQLAGLVMLDPENTEAKGLFFFGGIEGCRFRKPVVPGDVLVVAWRRWENRE